MKTETVIKFVLLMSIILAIVGFTPIGELTIPELWGYLSND